MDKCEKCGKLLDYLTARARLLMDTYTAVLCVRCRNLCEAWLTALPEWLDYVDLVANKEYLRALSLAGQRPNPDDWRTQALAEDHLRDRFFTLISEWVAEKIEQPEDAEGTEGTP